MGTNYYLHKEICPHCGRGDEPKHIGKSSFGWCFSLHVFPDEGINDLADWRKHWLTGVIKDEYGDILTPEQMEAKITQRQCKTPFSMCSWSGYKNEAEFHKINGSERGPNDLLRHRLSEYCIGHGEGTWDLLIGVYS
jgi:hypothetical protein